jgi:hypothetical protein
MGAKVPEDEYELPLELKYLYDAFMSVRFSRIPNGDNFSLMARDSLSYSDIHYNSILTGLEFEKFEVDAIMSMSAIFDKHSS